MKRKNLLRTCAALALSFTMLLGLSVPAAAANQPVQAPANAQEAAEAEYTEICDGGYKIDGSGYLFVGSSKAVLFDGNPRNAGAQATAKKLAGDKEIVNVSTSTPNGKAVELGGLTFQAIPVNGTLTGTVYLSAGRGVLVSGNLLGSGTAMLNKQVLDSDHPHLYYNNYCDYMASLDKINEKVGSMKDLTLCASGKVLDKQYFVDLRTIVTKFTKAEDVTSYVLKALETPSDFSIEWGSATIVVHMPIGGLYGYDLGGTGMYPQDSDQHRFYIFDYGKFQTIHDSDIQNCYLLMNDDEALIIDVDMYNGPLFFKTLCDAIGDRDLYIYITHQHGDHWLNLADFDPDRVTTLYWPADDIPSGGQWGGSYKAVTERFSGKMTFVKDGDELKIAGREFVVGNMTAHTPHGTVLINKTDRVCFSGDALGTRQYVGGTSTGSLTAEDYLAELNYITDTYGKYFDVVQQAHSSLVLPNEFETLKILTRAFIENGPDILIQGAVVSFMDKVLTPEEFAQIFGNGVFDSQIALAERLDIGKTAMEAYKAK